MTPKKTTRRRQTKPTRQAVLRSAPRNIGIKFMINRDESDLLEHFFKKYKVTNKSEYLRRTILQEVLRRLDQDYPTIFDTDEL